MKWNNKGHQFFHMENIIKKTHIDEGLYLFGAGLIGCDVAKKLKKTGLIKAFVDNDRNKQGTVNDGIEVISFERYQEYHFPGFMIICASEKNRTMIEKQLMESGMKEGEDFIYCKEFIQKRMIPYCYFFAVDMIYMPLIQISLTERCTLRCRKCAHACNLVEKNRTDLSFEDVKKSSDELFRLVDFCDEFVLIGGEPLLYEGLDKCIDYIGSNYRDKINIFSITTNGTLLPDSKLLNECHRWNVVFRISDYSVSLPRLKKRYEQLTQLLTENGIVFFVSKPDFWIDYGFDTVDNGSDGELLEKIFDRCSTPCHEVRGNKYYQCVMARSVSENMKNGLIGKNDYYDLASIKSEDDRTLFFEYIMGYSDKGFLDMCRYCRGMDVENYPIKVAEQM